MKRIILFYLLVVSFAAYHHANAAYLFDNPNKGLGFAVGGAKGDNSTADKWVVQVRGFLQYQIMPSVLLGQLSVGYTKLNAPGVYKVETTMADNRLLLIPFSLERLNPFLYGGLGISKAVDRSGSGYLAMIPMGVGFQTRLGSQMILEVSGGYNLSLSDKLDGRERSNSSLNNLTNKKHDGFFGFLIGLMFAGGSGQNGDLDRDGLSNQIEKELGTDPREADTDGDGLSDGDEANQYKTDPLKADTDRDGLNDSAELNQYRTDPLKADTDGDGLNDGNETRYNLDPLRTDTDGDGLNDGNEVRYKTDPLKTDTDNDGLSDGAEVNQFKTDPAKADTDGDGLSDGEEVNKYKTNPIKIDSDNGGVNDGAEVKKGTDPLNWKDDVAKGTTTLILEKGKKIILRGINFEFNKATLTGDSETILEVAYNALVANPDIQVEISGHTDSVGSDEYNQDLSLRRAQTVRNWLEQRGVRSDRMNAAGKGELEPIADNDSEEGRAENRRIEFYVQQ